MSLTAEEITEDWQQFLDDYHTHAEENGHPHLSSDVRAEPPKAYFDFMDEYPFDHDETPDFIEVFEYKSLRDMARRDVQFLTEKEWKEERDQELEDATEEWVWPYLKREEFLNDSRADWEVEDVVGQIYYYQDH